MSNSIAVLGANGFIGQHLTLALAKQDQNRTVRAFGFYTDNEIDNPNHPFAAYQNIEIIRGDFLNSHDVESVVEGAEYVFHLVSTTTPATSAKDPFIDIDTNLRGSIELFQLCAKHGVKRVIFPSSGGTVYGNAEASVINEETVPRPVSPYGITKLCIENYLRFFKVSHGLDYVIYRIANPYGPGQNIKGEQGVIPIFINKLLSEKPLTVYGDGHMVRDYIYISDLIEMIMASYDKPCNYAEYNLGSGAGISVNEIIAALQSNVSTPISIEHLETPSTFVEKIVLDTTRFNEEFSVPASTNIHDGIALTWEYVKSVH